MVKSKSLRNILGIGLLAVAFTASIGLLFSNKRSTGFVNGARAEYNQFSVLSFFRNNELFLENHPEGYSTTICAGSDTIVGNEKSDFVMQRERPNLVEYSPSGVSRYSGFSRTLDLKAHATETELDSIFAQATEDFNRYRRVLTRSGF